MYFYICTRKQLAKERICERSILKKKKKTNKQTITAQRWEKKWI